MSDPLDRDQQRQLAAVSTVTLLAELKRRALNRPSTVTLLAELKRRALNRPFTGIPELTAATLVDMYVDDEGYRAVEVTAKAAQVAVHYLDREAIEGRMHTRLTDAQWARVAEHLDEYDEWLEGSGADESIAYFARDYLMGKAGLDYSEDLSQIVDVEAVDQ